MISSIVKNSPIIKNKMNKEKNFPIQLKKKFYKLRMKLNTIKDLKENEKLGKDKDGKYIVFENRYFQQTIRWFYGENREETKKYLDDDFTSYMKFLDEMCYYLEKDILGVYIKFGEQIRDYNNELMKGLYILKATYKNSSGEKDEIIAKIDSIILTLIDFKDKLINYKKFNDKKYTSFENMNNKIFIKRDRYYSD